VTPPDDPLKRHPFGDDGRVDPDNIAPDDEEKAAGPDAPDRGLITRALSVVPFLLVAAFGLIGIIAWALIIVFGAGGGEPVWRALQGLSLAAALGQLALAVLIGLVPLGLTLAASWATAHGFREDAGRTFWTVAQALWGLAAVGLVVLDRAGHRRVTELGFSALDWWFMFGVVAFAMIIAGVRLRRAPRATARRSS
jgi:nitrate reductase NapE component